MPAWLVDLLLGDTGLSGSVFILLCAVSFAGSFITASMGIGGGGLVLATFALTLPPPVLIPLHGFVQLGSNLGRTILMLREVLYAIVPAFLIGTIAGAVLGGYLVVTLPIKVLQLTLALFILYSTWAPKFAASNPGKRAFLGVGAVGAFVTMFVGATGPLIAPFVTAACHNRLQIVATHATLMTIQHGLKIITFGLLGFSFGPYLPLLIGLLLFGFAGTYTGKALLKRLPENLFRIGLKSILTVLALKLLFDALTG